MFFFRWHRQYLATGVQSGQFISTATTTSAIDMSILSDNIRFSVQAKHKDTKLMKITPLGLAGGRSYDRTNSLRTPTMKESQLLREKTTSSVFVATCSNAVHAQFHWLAYTRNTRPCDVVCLQSKHFRSIAGILLAPRAKIYARDRSRSRWNMKHFRQTARGCLLHQ